MIEIWRGAAVHARARFRGSACEEQSTCSYSETMVDADTTSTIAVLDCPRCGKPPALCVCAGIEPIDNRVALLILQHPQEQDRELGTARLAVLHLRHAAMKIGLSWPSLAKAVGREVNPKRWAVLYLGAATAASLPPGREITLLDSKGGASCRSRSRAGRDRRHHLAGWQLEPGQDLVVAQSVGAEMPRLALNPKQPSRYGKLRRDPRCEGLSTLEAAALALARLGRQAEIETVLTTNFSRLLERLPCRQYTRKVTELGRLFG